MAVSTLLNKLPACTLQLLPGNFWAVLSFALLLSACASANHGTISPTQPLSPNAAPAVPATQSVTQETFPKQEIRFAVAGDVMAHATQIEAAYDEKCDFYNFKPVFATAVPLFKDVDVSIANLETTLPGKNYSGYPAFGAPDTLVDAASSAGINFFTTANNHCLDKGRDGLIRTLQVLDEKGVQHLGTYASAKDYEQQRIFLLNKNGLTVALLDYTYGTNNIPTPKGIVVNRIEKSRISEDILLARQKHADVVIVLFHFGKEYLNKPDAYQRDMVSHALASGADIVLGGHPHHVQPYELLRYQGQEQPRLVAYSLGNFVSAQRHPYTDGGMVLYFTLVKKQDAAGKSAIDITDVHHKLVWIYISHEDARMHYHILPIDTYLDSPGDLKLPQAAIDGMKNYRDEVEEVLSFKVDEMGGKR